MKKCFLTKSKPQRRSLGQTGLSVSCVGMGVLPMGPGQLALPLDEGAAVICDALRRGIDFLDTAQYYRTYPYIRRALELMHLTTRENLCGPSFSAMQNPQKNARADESFHVSANTASAFSLPVISSKSLASTYEEMMDAILECRRELDLSVIDIFLMHEVRTGQFGKRSAAWQALQDAKAAGLVRAIGISTHHVDVVREMAEVPACDVVFALLNYRSMGIRNGFLTGTKEEMAAALASCKAAGKGVYIMKALGGGNLTGEYQKALDYVFAQDCVDAVMVGFTHTSEIDDMMCYLSGNMESSYNPDVSRKKMYVNQEDCEGCGTCLKICAAGAVSYNKNGLAEIDQSRCLTCGYCAQGCPVRAIIMY